MSSTGPAGGHAPNTSGPASQLHGRSQYAKGAVEETLGKITGALGLKSAGKADQSAGYSELYQAKQTGSRTTGPVASTSKSDSTVVGGGSS